MSRILKVMIVLLAITAMVAPTVFAEDRLSLAGSMRVRGFYADNDNDFTRDNQSHAWNDQRLRIGGKISVAEGVSVNFRFDTTESDENNSNAVAWGGTQTNYAPYSQRRADIQFDKAYLQIEKGGYTIAAGQQYFGGFGTGHLLDAVGTGFIVKRGPVYLAHIKQYDENNGNDSFTKNTTRVSGSGTLLESSDERSLTAASFTWKNDDVMLKPMATYVFDQGSDFDRLGLGLYGTANLGAIALKGEIDYFTGENTPAIDAKGLQVYLDASTAVSETVTVGGILLYAQGQDGSDAQATYQSMPVFAEWHPENYGPWSTDFVQEFDTFDPTDEGAGVMGLEIYTNVKINDDLGLQASATYLETEDDDVADADGYVLNGSLSYALAANTTLNGHLNYTSLSVDSIGNDSAESGDIDTFQAISGLTVKF